MNDIIFALASAKGRAGVSVIRISGDNSITSVEKILRKNLSLNNKCLRKIYDSNNSVIDEVLILTFEKRAVLRAMKL